MKTIQYILLSVGVAMAMLACRNNDYQDMTNPQEYEFSITVSATPDNSEPADPKSRAMLEEGTYDYYWAYGDKIGLFATSVDFDELKLSNVKMINNNHNPATITTFDGKLSDDQYAAMNVEGTYQYVAYYPYQQSAVLNEIDYKLSGLTLPTVQEVTTVGADGFRSDCDFMFTSFATAGSVITDEPQFSQEDNTGFKHLFSAIRMWVSMDGMGGQKVKSITLKAPGKNLTGEFSVNLLTRVVEFTKPVDSVTVNIPSGMELSTGDACVWAIINPVDLSSTTLTMTITTESGYQYKHIFDVTETYAAGNFYPLAIQVPEIGVTADILTSYTNRSNSLDGSSIYFNNIDVTKPELDKGGYGYSVDITEIGCICDGRIVYSTSDSSLSSYTHTVGSYAEWGTYDAQVYIKLANGAMIKSDITEAHVTGIPYVQSMRGISSLPSGWSGEKLAWDGYGWGAGDGTNCLILRMDTANEVESNGKVLTPKFYLPAETSVAVSWSSSVYGSDSRDARLYVTPSAGTYTSGSNMWTQSSTVGFYNEASWASPSPAKSLSLSSTNPYISFTVNPTQGSGGTTGYMRFREISIKY